MAGTETAQSPNTSKPMKELWQIHYSRFFSFPRILSKFPDLHPLDKRCMKNNRFGKWVSSSSSMSALHLTYDQNARGFVLIVMFQGKVYEEHYISKLIFSWPQVACLDECPARGSRVVFASYRDSLGQVQKFAMRFSSSSDSQTFINSLKEGLKDIRNVGLTSNGFGSETSPSEHIPPKTAYERPAKELSNVNPVGNCGPVVHPVSSHEITKHTCLEKPLPVHGSEASCTPLPSSFTALLEDDEEPPKAPEAFYVNNEVTGWIADSSFNDMLRKLEMVIHTLGGDLSL